VTILPHPPRPFSRVNDDSLTENTCLLTVSRLGYFSLVYINLGGGRVVFNPPPSIILSLEVSIGDFDTLLNKLNL